MIQKETKIMIKNAIDVEYANATTPDEQSDVQDSVDFFEGIIKVLKVFPVSIKDGGSATIDCPLCNGKNTLHCSVAEINKHHAAHCSKCKFNIME